MTAFFAHRARHVFQGLWALLVSACCGVPSYSPAFWNSNPTALSSNNCYNYSNNHRTDTYAQPGRAAGAMYTAFDCSNVANAAKSDGLVPMASGGSCPPKCQIALVVAPGLDFHWYRLDSGGRWSHKPGMTSATNLDNSGNPIADPTNANRGAYTDFCGYFCSCSDPKEGQGHETIL